MNFSLASNRLIIELLFENKFGIFLAHQKFKRFLEYNSHYSKHEQKKTAELKHIYASTLKIGKNNLKQSN